MELSRDELFEEYSTPRRNEKEKMIIIFITDSVSFLKVCLIGGASQIHTETWCFVSLGGIDFEIES